MNVEKITAVMDKFEVSGEIELALRSQPSSPFELRAHLLSALAALAALLPLASSSNNLRILI